MKNRQKFRELVSQDIFCSLIYDKYPQTNTKTKKKYYLEAFQRFPFPFVHNAYVPSLNGFSLIREASVLELLSVGLRSPTINA